MRLEVLDPENLSQSSNNEDLMSSRMEKMRRAVDQYREYKSAITSQNSSYYANDENNENSNVDKLTDYVLDAEDNPNMLRVFNYTPSNETIDMINKLNKINSNVDIYE